MSFVPYDDRDGWIWMDGSFVPWREAKVHILTHALHYGSSVFEGERSYNGTIFEGHRHSNRLLNSANILGMKAPCTAEQIDDVKKEAMAKNGLENCYVRAVMWRGSEMMGVSAQSNTIHTAVAVWDWGNYYADKMTGIRMGRAKWQRPAPNTAPHDAKAAGLYMICTLSKHAAEAEGYADALMLDYRGQVAEATSANIFFVQDGAIHTPTPDCFLNGITRQTVIKIAKEKGYEVVERKIEPEELGNFSECFTTGSAAEVTPVKEIAGIHYQPGRICEDLVVSYENLVRGK
ncbi:MAG: branched-chain amino acid aminotransferase [Caulobacterales bacterium]|nr:branched-chain amino acid aminotransferase [Caulobacterales bacterium]MCA0373299.1 branched-chain amino acid aminotransferase [Pseudomonadota bacterium]